jgi:hypothetical protein
MKTHQIELQRIKAMSQGNGLVELQIDASVLPAGPPADGKSPVSWLRMSEETARVMYTLLRGQLAEIDKRKARSQR